VSQFVPFIRDRPPRRHAGRRELALFAAAYLTYFGVRAITEGRAPTAFDNAEALIRVERGLGIGWERAVQTAVVGSHGLMEAANAIYIYGHWPVLIVTGVLLFLTRRHHYYTLRNACLLTGLFGLAIFALFPVAPPRLTDMPVVDTVTRGSPGYRQLLPPSLVNEYAAMPSFHAGWNLLVGIVVFRATRQWLLRGFALLMPLAMAFAVVATANHFVIDVVAGTLMVLTALALLDARAARSTLPGGEPGQHRDRERTGHGRSISRRAPRGQRPWAVAQRRGAGHPADRGGRASVCRSAGGAPSQDRRAAADSLGSLDARSRVDAAASREHPAGRGRAADAPDARPQGPRSPALPAAGAGARR
jgi:membrane-associated phospholipid phosphatase